MSDVDTVGPAKRKPQIGEVKFFDNMLRCTVGSGSRKRVTHLVDLAAYNGNGRCTCEHFTMTMEPELKKMKGPHNRYRCKHILAARHYFCNNMIKAIRKQELEQAEANKKKLKG